MPEHARAYPLREQPDTLRSHSGKRLNDISDEAIAEGRLTGDDLRVHADTLQKQADIAQEHGYPQLAGNLRRGAELTRVPNDELLRIYDMLRPERASYAELLRLADYLEASYDAKENAAFIREAAQVYRERDLLRR